MLNLFDTVRGQCEDVDPALIERHFRRLPMSYFERYSPTEVARHLRLIGLLAPQGRVEVEVRPLASQVFEVVVVGLDCSGTVACITAALAAFGFDLEDVQVSPYLGDEAAPADPGLFVIVLRVTGGLRGRMPGDLALELKTRLTISFSHLLQGNLVEAQRIAAETPSSTADSTVMAADRPSLILPRQKGFEEMILGGDFRMDRKLATGGMSEVYLSTQVSLNRTVAVKVFRHNGKADDEYLARINNEAMVLAQFSCAQIVQILAAGAAQEPTGGVLGWMAMEYMAGGDLGRWLQKHGPAPMELGLRWFKESLEGLQYAHRRSILHRDLKPHNLLLTAEMHLKVSDFGLLKHAETLNADLTPYSAIVGTPHYMSPEQALGEPLDERSDIFSLGTTFFYLLSGRLPFQKSTPAAVLVQIAQEDAPRLSEVSPQTPAPLAVLIGRMMARKREERYQDVAVILEDLASYERRGLLSFAQNGSVPAVAIPTSIDNSDMQTQAYQPKAG